MEKSKCQDLEEELEKLRHQLAEAHQMNQLDQDTIAQLREVIGKIYMKLPCLLNVRSRFKP